MSVKYEKNKLTVICSTSSQTERNLTFSKQFNYTSTIRYCGRPLIKCSSFEKDPKWKEGKRVIW